MDMNTQSPKILTEIPGPRSQQRAAQGSIDMQSFYRSLVVDTKASQGAILVDVDGNRFLDLFSGFALGALGYNHPRLTRVASSPAFAQAAVNPTSNPFMPSEGWLETIEALGALAAPTGLRRMFCVDAGGEGVEAALKAAFMVHAEEGREARGQPRDPLAQPEDVQGAWMANGGTDAVVVSFEGAFHGRGLGPLSATHSKVIHKADLPAFPWPSVPFPALRWPLERHQAENKAIEDRCVESLERTLEAHAGRVAAVLVEPIQSEGGDRHASPSFFQRAQALAAQAGAAFILDEVQTGMGITGTLWAHEQLELSAPPDMVCFGKKMQMGGFFASARYDVRQFGRMYQTRNGDLLRAMLALGVVETIRAEGLLRQVQEVGARMLRHLTALADRHPQLVSDPRGRGLLMAFDLPTPALRDELLRRARAHGVLATYTGTRSVRLRPHLITAEADVDLAAEVFDRALKEMGA